jgi:hypothetical protein
MIFPADHPTFPDNPKRMKQIFSKQGLFQAKLKMQCKKTDCDPDATDCCAKHIIDLQLDFKEQKSLVHKTIGCWSPLHNASKISLISFGEQ